MRRTGLGMILRSFDHDSFRGRALRRVGTGDTGWGESDGKGSWEGWRGGWDEDGDLG